MLTSPRCPFPQIPKASCLDHWLFWQVPPILPPLGTPGDIPERHASPRPFLRTRLWVEKRPSYREAQGTLSPGSKQHLKTDVTLRLPDPFQGVVSLLVLTEPGGSRTGSQHLGGTFPMWPLSVVLPFLWTCQDPQTSFLFPVSTQGPQIGLKPPGMPQNSGSRWEDCSSSFGQEPSDTLLMITLSLFLLDF